MTNFHIDFYYSGLQRTAEIKKESNKYHLKYTIHFPGELAGVLKIKWMEILYEYPVTHFNTVIIAPLAKIRYSNPMFEEVEVIDIMLRAIGKREYRREC